MLVKKNKTRHSDFLFPPHRVEICGQLLDGRLQVFNSFQAVLEETEGREAEKDISELQQILLVE